MKLLLLFSLLVAACLPSAPALAADDFSAAEQAIFMADQITKLRPPTTLRYSFRKAGSLEPGFDDAVSLAFNAQADGKCCVAHGEFLSGPRKASLPEIENGKSNPVTLYFLEHDIREMNRLTKGSQNYFRKRIRMAVYQGAKVTPASFKYRGKTVAGQEIILKPYADDPNRARFEKFSDKEYHFMLSDAVPGGVYGIRTQVSDTSAAGTPVLLSEEMLIEGAESAPNLASAARQQ
jgi:hypothetical protein